MYRITKVIYINSNGSKKIDKAPYLTCHSKEQLEALRALLIKNTADCQDVRLVYEER